MLICYTVNSLLYVSPIFLVNVDYNFYFMTSTPKPWLSREVCVHQIDRQRFTLSNINHEPERIIFTLLDRGWRGYTSLDDCNMISLSLSTSPKPSGIIPEWIKLLFVLLQTNQPLTSIQLSWNDKLNSVFFVIITSTTQQKYLFINLLLHWIKIRVGCTILWLR